MNLNIENIFFNGYLMTPDEMIDFVDSFKSPRVRVHFDTGNIMLFQFPEHWIRMLGPRIQNVHLKEFTKKGTDYSLESFRPLLDGTTNWPAVMEAFDQIGYRGLPDVRILPPLAALSRSAGLSDVGFARPDAGPNSAVAAGRKLNAARRAAHPSVGRLAGRLRTKRS